MLKNKSKYMACLLIFIITSCVKDVDFEQAENLMLTPVIASSVVYTDVEASRFSLNGMELEEVSDTIANIEIFSEAFVIDNLVKAELVFEATNTINRTFGLQVEFLDDADVLLDAFSFNAQPSVDNNEVVTNVTEVYENERLEALKQTTRMVITLILFPSMDGSVLNEDSTGRIILKSKGIFYLNVNV